MGACAAHREYLAAIADGEPDLVPLATLEHVKTCADCAREIHAHQVLSSRLRQADDMLGETPSKQRALIAKLSRIRIIAAAAAALILVGATGVVWFVVSRPDPVQAAVNASSQPLQVQSTDPARVSQWCLQASGKSLPTIQLDGMQVVGARMDRAGSTGIVTVVYSAPSGDRVSVSWLEGQVPSGTGVEAKNISGRELLVVHASVGTAVITATSSDAMWQAAAAIEAAST